MTTSYGTIVADPPWRYTQKPTQRTGRGASAEHLYPTMRTEEIAAMPVSGLAAADAHLYLWVTNPVILGMRPTIRGELEPCDVVRAWGFEPKALLTWVKTTRVSGEPSKGGMGWYFRGATEHVIFAVRGRAPIPPEDRLPNIFEAPKTRHSAKPGILYDIARRVSPGLHLELFARTQRRGWDVWGNEVDSHVKLVA